MDTNPYKLKVFNTLTGKYEETAVSKEVYDLYRCANQRDKDNSARFFAHEIQFSSLIGSQDDSYENFEEFVSFESDPFGIVCSRIERERLIQLLSQLPSQDRDLLKALFFDCQTEREYADANGLTKSFVARRRKKNIDALKKDSAFKKQFGPKPVFLPLYK